MVHDGVGQSFPCVGMCATDSAVFHKLPEQGSGADALRTALLLPCGTSFANCMCNCCHYSVCCFVDTAQPVWATPEDVIILDCFLSDMWTIMTTNALPQEGACT